MDFAVFDLEISKTITQVVRELSLRTEGEAFNYPHKCGFSVGVVNVGSTKQNHIFDSASMMAKFLLKFDGLLVSFNGVRFDTPALLNDCDIDTFLALQKKSHLDILADFYDKVHGRFRVSLNNIAENTIGKTKSGSGADAPLLFQQGKMDELIDYCRNDVLLTKEIFEFGVNNGYINYLDKETGKVEEMKVQYYRWLEEEDTDAMIAVKAANTSQSVCECGHERRYHALPKNHILGTSHCTMLNCMCKEYKEQVAQMETDGTRTAKPGR